MVNGTVPLCSVELDPWGRERKGSSALRKAVAVALVLIAGAAVVLWFGNRLNSWVLGGLIGGLASLLLSIPIAWVLFSYFAHQHNEQQQQSTRGHSKRVYSDQETPLPGYLPQEIDPDYYDDKYVMENGHLVHELDGEVFYTNVEEHRQLPATGRNSGWLDEEFGHSAPLARRLPPDASSQHITGNVSSRHLPAPYNAQQQRTTTRRTGYPGLPASQQGSFRSRFRSEALRTARLEAVRQYMEENDAFPTQIPIDNENSTSSRRRRSPQQGVQDTRNDGPTRPSSRAVPRSSRPNRRTVDSLPPFNRSEQDALPGYIDEVEEPYIDPSPRSRRGREPQTDHILPDSSAGDIRRSLLRRAPYTYEDDEVRQEMLRYSKKPPIRRSSRYLQRRRDEDQTQ
jgi:hypothetical protein